MRAALISLLVVAGWGSSWASSRGTPVHVAQEPVREPSTVFIEFHLRAPVGPYIPIVVRQGAKGPKAQLRLLPQPGHPNIYTGSFAIEFSSAFDAKTELEFSDLQGNDLFASVHRTRFQKRYRLFGNEELRNRYKAQQPPDEEFEARPQAVAAPTPKPADVPVVKAPEIDLKALEEERKRQEEARRVDERRREEERLQTEMNAAKRREQLRLEQERLSAAAKAKRKADARALGESALVLYREGQYDKAATEFAQATEMDPENDAYYFQYAVTMYKVGEYDKSLALFSLADGPSVNAVEKDYYVALNHMRLREFDKALKGFGEVQAETESELSPVAAYFAGTIQFQNESYADARKSFEHVLDHSKDPKMDAEAERQIEEINRIENFLASAKERFRLGLTMGAIYDNNILNVATENLATDVAGVRANYGATLLGHIYRTHQQDLSAQIGVNDYYSLNTKLQGDATLQATDALELSLNLPYQRQMEFAGYGHTLLLTPSYKSLALAIGGGSRSTVITSTGATLSLATALRADWISELKLDGGSDVSSLEIASPDDDQSASRWNIGTSQTKLLHISGSELVSFDLNVGHNGAKGVNFRSNRMAAAFTYMRPGPWQAPLALRLDYSTQDFPEALNERNDRITSLTLSHMKTLSPSWMLTSTLMGSSSTSTQELFSYNKFMASMTLAYTLSVGSD